MIRILINTLIVVFAALILGGVSYLWAYSGKSNSKSTPPNFTTKNIMTNKSITLSNYRGKVVLVNFWATWCPPCKAEIPSLNKMYEHYDGKVSIIAISVDRSEDSKVVDFAKENNMTFDIAHDTDIIVRAYRIDPIPTTYIIDKKGRIVKKFVGMVTWDSEETYAFIDKLIAASEADTVKKAKK